MNTKQEKSCLYFEKKVLKVKKKKKKKHLHLNSLITFHKTFIFHDYLQQFHS